MSRIGLIIAMDCEKQALVDMFQHYEEEVVHGKVFTKTSYLNHEIVIVLAGIGKVNAAMATTLLIDKYRPDLIINSGIAGGYDRKLKTLDLVVATSISYSDVIVCTCEEEKYGQIPGLPEEFVCETKIVKELFNEDIHYGKVLSGDQFVVDYEKEARMVNEYFKSQNILAFDMEAGSVAQVCHIMNTPLISLKCISDIIGETNLTDYYTFSIKASKKIGDFVYKILTKIK